MPTFQISPSTLIRPIEVKDYATMCGIIEQFLFGEVPDMPKVNTLDDVRNIFLRTPFICYYVIEHEGKIVGGGGLRELAGSMKTCEGSRMYFSAEVRGKGFAIPLLRALSQEAMKRGYIKVLLETQPAFMVKANSIYERCGFERTFRTPSFCFRKENTFMQMYLQERSMEEYPMPTLAHPCSTPMRYRLPQALDYFYITVVFMGLDQEALVKFLKPLLNLMDEREMIVELALLPEQIQAKESPESLEEDEKTPQALFHRHGVLPIGFFNPRPRPVAASSTDTANLESAELILEADDDGSALPRETLFSIRALELACEDRPNVFTHRVKSFFPSLTR